MSKAKEIMEKDISVFKKLELMEKHFETCGKWADEHQTEENTDAVLLSLQEILNYIKELEGKV